MRVRGLSGCRAIRRLGGGADSRGRLSLRSWCGRDVEGAVPYGDGAGEYCWGFVCVVVSIKRNLMRGIIILTQSYARVTLGNFFSQLNDIQDIFLLLTVEAAYLFDDFGVQIYFGICCASRYERCNVAIEYG